MSRSKEFLVLQHVPYEHPGLLSDFARESGISLRIVKLWEPYTIPKISEYGALIIMGGPMSVYDSPSAYPSREDEIRIIKKALEQNVHILGICLGSQLLAHALGADVHPNIIDGKKVKEVGYYLVNLTGDGLQSRLFRGFSSPIEVLQWHGDVFDVPKGATLLAEGKGCKNQAFSYQNAYGLLFHFEFTPEMVEKQIEIDRGWIHQDHELDEDKLVEDAKHKRGSMERQCRQLFLNPLSIVEESQNEIPNYYSQLV